MNLVRFGVDGSMVHVQKNSHGQWECRSCELADRAAGQTVSWFNTNDSLLSHLDTHVVKGHHVPEWVFEELES